jgi:hypothetical protein
MVKAAKDLHGPDYRRSGITFVVKVHRLNWAAQLRHFHRQDVAQESQNAIRLLHKK